MNQGGCAVAGRALTSASLWVHLLEAFTSKEPPALAATTEDVEYLVGTIALRRLVHPYLLGYDPFTDTLATLLVEFVAFFTIRNVCTLTGAGVSIQHLSFTALAGFRTDTLTLLLVEHFKTVAGDFTGRLTLAQLFVKHFSI